MYYEKWIGGQKIPCLNSVLCKNRLKVLVIVELLNSDRTTSLAKEGQHGFCKGKFYLTNLFNNNNNNVMY